MISVIIPTLNEEKYIPKLLDCIKEQTYTNFEIIVVDANSKDNTLKIAKKYGCRIFLEPKNEVGHPGMARNIGAKNAKGEYLLFLDSDITFHKDFLKNIKSQLEQKKAVVATARPCTKNVIFDGLNSLYLDFFSIWWYPRAPGHCILILRKTFEKIKGFDTSLKLAEDHNLAKRAKKIGKFIILDDKINVSTRRWDKENKLLLFLKYLSVEIRLLFGIEIRNNFFRYEFGKY